MTPIEIVEDFVAAWNRMDMDKVFAMMDPDIVWHNIPLQPSVGLDDVKRLCGQLGTVRGCEWIIHAIAANGRTVLTERTDKFEFADGRSGAVRVMGTFELGADDKITHWRDYFDMGEYQRAFS